MPMRVTGMMSGLDTETIIQELVAAKQTKVDKLKKEQTRLEWKQDVWKELNSKIYKLYTGTLDSLVYQSSYMKKVTNSSNSNLVSISTKENAMDSVQELEITQMAKAGYLTGGKITNANGGRVTSGSKLTEALGIKENSRIEIAVGSKKVEITVDENMTISSFVDKLQSAGVKANFDATNQRIFVGASGTGESKDFTISAANANGVEALQKLGLLASEDLAAYTKYAGLTGDDKQKEINARIEELKAAYIAERNSIPGKNEALKKRQDELVAAYKDTPYGSNGDIEDDNYRADRITSLNDDIKAWKEKLKDENLSDEEKAEIQSDINKAEGELSYLNSYNTYTDEIQKNEARLAELNTDAYLGSDPDNVVVGSAIETEATDYVEAKIAAAQSAVTSINSTEKGSLATKIAGQDAVIKLNGAEFKSSTNTIEVNGLTITCKGETNGEKITLTTENDVSGIYDMIKNFIKEYSALVNEMDKLYNAESSKGYEPLTDEEKDAMSEKEVEKWEQKIKDSILRRDSTLSTVSTAMKQIMMSGFSVNGKTMYLSDFGIETLGYFNAADNEKNAYHINGDEDEDLLKNKDNTLMDMIKTDPNAVVSFFTQLSQSLHGKMKELMGRTDYSSINTVYDDKKMKEDYDGYKSKISDAEKKLQEYEDKWYKKFSAMETALAKMQSNANAVTSLLGGS